MNGWMNKQMNDKAINKLMHACEEIGKWSNNF